jgi:CRP/FNR family cyclic AMP-dependent transcriptional regulator
VVSGQTNTPHSGASGVDPRQAASAQRRSSSPSPSGIAGRSKQASTEPEALVGISLFRDLTIGQLSKLSALVQRKRYPAGTEIITVNLPGEIVYIVLDGSVKIHSDQPDGSNVIMAILGAGEVVGEMSLVDSLGRSASVTALEPSTLLLMDRATFWTSLRDMPTITYNLVDILSRRLRLANLHARSLSRLDVYGRVAGQLLAFAWEYGEAAPNGDVVIPLRLTQSDLASMVGASRVRVNQALSFYKRRNYLSTNRDRRIVIHDPGALSRRCS